ncbi:AAA family ATPase [Lacisediminihabitans changchengi]|uniref:Nuclease SbcCD subunit C n=1 Tax=Lacisediminihabitans changchengi TaxID=2787634 RepID=A0A934SKE2_9MICO|nr:SMC family ATPase [Lacisediminihabitans changchengi]MBK4346931.1 SMC family ATPase [Lacisediminihabitans changchengi]MBK4347946.1 SMC family ATPase [Lacisediminihabitans changchengi]
MKILRLRVAGFGPFKTEQYIDFERFDDDGIFLITGRTGAGKSSILDAVCFALYGSVPRYDGAQARLRSDHAEPDDPTVVELEFRVGSNDYRVRRSPEFARPKLRGTGTTSSPATAELAIREGDDWRVTAARPVDVGKDVLRLVGLSKDQFLQVILLAQNRFQEFLAAGNDDRQSVLRSLFGTDRFLAYETFLVERRRALEQQVAESSEAVSQHAAQFARAVELDPSEVPSEPELAWFDALLDELVAATELAESSAAVADAARAAAEDEFRQLDTVHSRQRRRDVAAATLQRHLSESVELERAAASSARRAAPVWPLIAARRAADNELMAARALELAARSAYASFDPPPVDTATAAITVQAVDEAIDALTRRLGSLEAPITDELALPSLSEAVDIGRAALSAIDESAARAVRQLEMLPGQLIEAQSRLSDARVAASAEGAAAATAARLEGAREAARERVRLEREMAAAQAAELVASQRLTGATTTHQLLMDRRFAGHAAELAGALVDGEPCAVCGSTAHPEPAPLEAPPVTSADIEEARAELTDRRTALDDATRVSTRLAGLLAESLARSEGLSLETIETQLSTALGAVRDARLAADLMVELDDEIGRLGSLIQQAEAEVEGLQARRHAAGTDLAARELELTSAKRRVSDHRNGFATVSERASALRLHLAAAKTLERAIDTTTERQRALEFATESLATGLAEQGFADETEAEDARVDSEEIRRLERVISDHDQSIATARSILAEPELRGLPETTVDLEPARAALLEAGERRDSAMSAASALRERVRAAAGLVAEARRRFAASADLRAEYGQLRELANAVQGKEPNTRRMRLETYVLAAQLEQIVAAANVRLRVMTSGRYALEHDDSVQYRNTQSGLGLSILDEHTGKSRATNSLSGGETFLASLALALGLAEVVTNQAGGIRLDTLFIDEGFGSLDAETLEIAMSTLDGLRAGGRTIGLISHVDSMKEQIPGKLVVSMTPRGDSTITMPQRIEPQQIERVPGELPILV